MFLSYSVTSAALWPIIAMRATTDQTGRPIFNRLFWSNIQNKMKARNVSHSNKLRNPKIGTSYRAKSEFGIHKHTKKAIVVGHIIK